MVTEGREFNSVSEAWQRADDMGSRWIFFPVCIVTTEGGFIRGVPDCFPDYWIGKNVKTLCKRFAENEKAVCAYIEGESPLLVFP